MYTITELKTKFEKSVFSDSVMLAQIICNSLYYKNKSTSVSNVYQVLDGNYLNGGNLFYKGSLERENLFIPGGPDGEIYKLNQGRMDEMILLAQDVLNEYTK